MIDVSLMSCDRSMFVPMYFVFPSNSPPKPLFDTEYRETMACQQTVLTFNFAGTDSNKASSAYVTNVMADIHRIVDSCKYLSTWTCEQSYNALNGKQVAPGSSGSIPVTSASLVVRIYFMSVHHQNEFVSRFPVEMSEYTNDDSEDT